ncbi:MAG: hypothetical protein ABI690_25975 [Chloroflexota bacterium]
MNETPSRRPMTFTFLELLDRTFRIYRENFLTIVGLVALVTVPITILELILNSATTRPLNSQSLGSAFAASSGVGLISNILNLIQTVLIYAPLTYIASEYLFNRKVSISEAFSGARDRFTKVGCGLILLGFVIVIFAIVVFFVGAIFPPLFALAGILIYVFVSASVLLFPVLTLEDVSSSAGITRSYSLGKRRFWAAIGLSLILSIIGGLLGAILGGSVTLLVLSIAPSTSTTLQYGLITFLTTLISIVITPLSPIGFTLLYYDIRVRSEGLDIMLDSSEGAGARPINFASPPNKFGLDGHDWRNIAILTIGGLVIGLLVSAPIIAFVNQYSRSLR